MSEHPITAISDFHAHIYFDEETLARALEVRDALAGQFPQAELGRVHERPVGPHPEWSYQVKFTPGLFSQIVCWLALNRRGLTVLIHPDTGDDLADHRDHAMWMGSMPPLDLDALG